MVNIKKGTIVFPDGFVLNRWTRKKSFLANGHAELIRETNNGYYHYHYTGDLSQDGIAHLTVCFHGEKLYDCVIIPIGIKHTYHEYVCNKDPMQQTYLLENWDIVCRETKAWLRKQRQFQTCRHYPWGTAGFRAGEHFHYEIDVFLAYGQKLAIVTLKQRIQNWRIERRLRSYPPIK